MNNTNSFEWTADACAELRRLWNEGLSSSVISARLQTKYRQPCSKNSVIGRAHRMKLKLRGNIIADPAKRYRPPKQAMKASRATVTDVHRIARGCLWPTGDAMPFVPCGAPAVEGKPYCELHCRIGFVKPAKPQRVEA